jgi:tetratricopeptide (TPR) repeat protein
MNTFEPPNPDYEAEIKRGSARQRVMELIGAGKQDEAIAAFKQNVAWYPNSANVYDSLAEAYEKTGKLALALPLYEKAAQLGAQNNDPNARVFKENFERVSEALKKSAR